MSIPIQLPISAQVIPVSNVFTATFNTPTINRYDFAVAANTNQVILELERQSVYIIERMAFSMDIPEAVFQSSIDVTPRLSFTRRAPNQQEFQRAMPFVNYYKDYETYMFFNTTQSNDALRATFTGSLVQVPETVGLTEISAYVQLTIYKINDQPWVARYMEAKEALGDGLRFRGRDPRPY